MLMTARYCYIGLGCKNANYEFLIRVFKAQHFDMFKPSFKHSRYRLYIITVPMQ